MYIGSSRQLVYSKKLLSLEAQAREWTKGTDLKTISTFNEGSSPPVTCFVQGVLFLCFL